MKHFLQNEKIFQNFSTLWNFIDIPRRRLLCFFSSAVFFFIFSFSNAQVKFLPNFFSTSATSSNLLAQQKNIFYSPLEYFNEKNNDSNFESGSPTCISATSGVWNNPATWSCGVVPGPTDDVIIASGTTVTIDPGPSATTCANIAINTNGSLVASGGATLEVTGSWTNNGTFNAGIGTVNFKGSTSSTISGRIIIISQQIAMVAMIQSFFI